MNLNSILFLERYPKLDLHGYDRETARVAVNDFIRDNLHMKQEFCLIIHGIGTGVLRKMTHETLRKNKDVLQYQIQYFNPGCTIVQIKI